MKNQIRNETAGAAARPPTVIERLENGDEDGHAGDLRDLLALAEHAKRENPGTQGSGPTGRWPPRSTR